MCYAILIRSTLAIYLHGVLPDTVMIEKIFHAVFTESRGRMQRFKESGRIR